MNKPLKHIKLANKIVKFHEARRSPEKGSQYMVCLYHGHFKIVEGIMSFLDAKLHYL